MPRAGGSPSTTQPSPRSTPTRSPTRWSWNSRTPARCCCPAPPLRCWRSSPQHPSTAPEQYTNTRPSPRCPGSHLLSIPPGGPKQVEQTHVEQVGYAHCLAGVGIESSVSKCCEVDPGGAEDGEVLGVEFGERGDLFGEGVQLEADRRGGVQQLQLDLSLVDEGGVAFECRIPLLVHGAERGLGRAARVAYQ